MLQNIDTDVSPQIVYAYHRGQTIKYGFLAVALSAVTVAGSMGGMKGLTHTDPREVCAPQDDACYTAVQRDTFQRGMANAAMLMLFAGAAGVVARDEFAKAKKAKAALPKARQKHTIK